MPVLGLLLVVAFTGCRDEGTSRPSILLISVDTLRSDHLGCYGYERSTSPSIDKLARDGVVFDDVMSTCSWTLPSHASMLTGLYPSHHGLQDDGAKLAPRIRTLADALAGRGYHNVAVVSHVYVSSTFGLDRGFHTFDDSLILRGARNPIAREVVDRFLELEPEMPDRPFFAFLHFFDPHWDYTAPPPHDALFSDPAYEGRVDGTSDSLAPFHEANNPMPEPDRQEMIARYDGEIRYLDREIGRLLSALDRRGRLDNTLIVLTGDHGEEFKEHFQLGHGRTLFDEQLRVPLILSGLPEFPAGARRSDLVSPLDLPPTLLELAGSGGSREFQGRSLLSGDDSERRLLVAESIRFGFELRAARLGDIKAIHYRQENERYYFDVSKDPEEHSPLREDPTGGSWRPRWTTTRAPRTVAGT